MKRRIHPADRQPDSRTCLRDRGPEIAAQSSDHVPKLGSRSLCVLFASALILTGWLGAANAQSLASPTSPPVVGSVGGLPIPAQPFAGSQSAGAKVHLGPTGKPCLIVMGEAVPEIYDATIFSHTVIAKNDCSVPIKAQVCYYQSQKCSPLSVPPYGRSQVVLGIMPALNQFRFEYREQFDGGMTPKGFHLN